MAKRFRKKRKEIGGEKAPVDSAKSDAVVFSFTPDWTWGVLLAVMVIASYIPVWWAGYIWDDDKMVATNAVIVGPQGLWEIWTTNAADICPFTLSTFWLEHKLWGLAPLPYHLVNVALHAGCAVVLWRVLLALRIPGAWLGAALWAVHPVQVESVAWITEMKNTESGLFYLLSILFFVRSLNAVTFAKDYALTLLFAFLALASKSSTVILPVVLCLCAWWKEGRWKWSTAIRSAPVFLLSLVAGLVTIWTQGRQLEEFHGPLLSRSAPERLLDAGYVVWFYLGKLVWPYPLITLYPQWHLNPGDAFAYLPLLAVIVISIVFWLYRKSWSSPLLWAWAYYLVALLPVLGLANNSFFYYSLVADHFQYLADMGPLALLGSAMARLANIFISGKKALQSILATGAILLLGALSFHRCLVYQNAETLWKDDLAHCPDSWAAYNNLGNAYALNGQLDASGKSYQRSLEINPDNDSAHNNLAAYFIQKGRYDEAIAEAQKALSIRPNYPDAFFNLGSALMQKGQLQEAVDQFMKGLSLNPNPPKYHAYLGQALAQQGRMVEAVGEYQKALAIDPDDLDANYNLAVALAPAGQVDDAIRYYKRALKVAPDNVKVLNNLANLLFQKDDLDGAIALFQKALQFHPEDAKAHHNLAALLIKQGRYDEAVAQLQEIVRLDPSDPDAQKGLAHAQEMAREKSGQK